MSEEKNFLQTIKLEISRTFKLVPYERISFHRILGILKSQVGLAILLKELDKGPDIRRSAIATLVNFDNPDVLAALLSYLNKNISEFEKVNILNHIEKYGKHHIISEITAFIEREKNEPDSTLVLSKAFSVLKKIGTGSEEALNYLLTTVTADDSNTELKTFAINALSSFKVISTYEELLKINDDLINYSVYKSLYILINDLMDKASLKKTDDDRLYTYSPDNEDKIILDIRVLLGKMAAKFDNYSNETKVAFINSMLSSNHREFLIYIMKALTSNDSELISMVLYSLHANINRLRDPDKLFRSLIALSIEKKSDNDLIVDILVKFFSTPNNTRSYHILQDKLYSYIIVTLETYFETYRKEFMITDVIEKGYPESFQKIRKFILEKCTPELKKNIVAFLLHDESALIKHILNDLSKWITYIEESEEESLNLLLEVLYDKDVKSRENSASRIEDINFEKKYLRNRIMRLCKIIGKLNINDSASTLVNIYNYLKKYPDYDIMPTIIYTLSILNYSYMLGEIEVLLTTGNEEDQKKSLQLISLFSEQRSLNILLELLKNRIALESEIVEQTLIILLERDIIGNATAEQIFKAVIEQNKNQKIRSLAILGVGLCGFESDIDYLNELFYKMNKNESKDVIVRAIGDIMSINTAYNKRQLVKYLQEYLKDPGIKVRIYSCLLLARLGNKDAIRSIRDMLIIKNKSIQRDILTILGNLRSIEFSFFLLSLLKEEYAIFRDIIPIIEMLPEEDVKEIDGFIVNIFRKYEAPELEGITSQPIEAKIISLKDLKEEEKTLLIIDIFYLDIKQGNEKIPELISLNLIIKSLIESVILNNNGIITKMSNKKIIAYFPDPIITTTVSLQILDNIKIFNKTKIYDKCINIFLQLITDKIKILNDEIIEYPKYKFAEYNELPLQNKIITNKKTFEKISEKYTANKIPEIVLQRTSFFQEYFEILNPINFSPRADHILNKLIEDYQKKEQAQLEIEAEIKKLKRIHRSSSSAAIARELDVIGQKLESQLEEIERYVQRRSTDRELIKNVRKMLSNAINLYKVEISRIIID